MTSNMGGLKKTTKETLSDQHKRFQKESERYLGLIGKLKKQIARLDIKIKQEEDSIMEKERQNGSYIDNAKRPRTKIKHMRILEDHVHQATLRFDKLMSEIQDLRNDIDQLRQQRATMTSMYQRLSRELEQQQHVMEGLVEKSVRAYDQRSAVLKRMQIRDRGEDSEEDRRRWTELNELRRVNDHETKLRKFMLQKSQERRPVQKDDGKNKEAEQACVVGYSPETYQAVKQRIMELTGESDLHQIASTFVENEKKNFASLIYINELSNKATQLQHRSSQLKTEIEQLELKELQFEGKCEVQLKELEAELELKRLKANTLEDKSTNMCKVLAEQKSAISDLFTQLNCDPTPLRNQLGGITELTDDNVTQFIGVLESYLLKMLMSYMQTTFKQAEGQKLQSHRAGQPRSSQGHKENMTCLKNHNSQ
ncbi:coiled-coil domain-containing protein 63-like isoform X2 [Brachyhypopomus gauderio]